jgi:hypothetical protein
MLLRWGHWGNLALLPPRAPVALGRRARGPRRPRPRTDERYAVRPAAPVRGACRSSDTGWPRRARLRSPTVHARMDGRRPGQTARRRDWICPIEPCVRLVSARHRLDHAQLAMAPVSSCNPAASSSAVHVCDAIAVAGQAGLCLCLCVAGRHGRRRRAFRVRALALALDVHSSFPRDRRISIARGRPAGTATAAVRAPACAALRPVAWPGTGRWRTR